MTQTQEGKEDIFLESSDLRPKRGKWEAEPCAKLGPHCLAITPLQMDPTPKGSLFCALHAGNGGWGAGYLQPTPGSARQAGIPQINFPQGVGGRKKKWNAYVWCIRVHGCAGFLCGHA